MKLLLTSQGIHNKSIETALRSLLGKPSKECRAVYISTSQNGAVGDKSWFVRNLNDAFNVGWKLFEIIDLAAMIDLPKSMWWERIQKSDVLFVGGGANYYLGYWMEKSGLADVLPEMLKTKVYVGASAGSIFLTNSTLGGTESLQQFAETGQINPSILGPEGQRSARTLKLVDIELRPHYNDGNPKRQFVTDELLQKAANFSGHKMYALNDDSALKITDGSIEVVSEGEWKMFEPNGQA